MAVRGARSSTRSHIAKFNTTSRTEPSHNRGPNSRRSVDRHRPGVPTPSPNRPSPSAGHPNGHASDDRANGHGHASDRHASDVRRRRAGASATEASATAPSSVIRIPLMAISLEESEFWISECMKFPLVPCGGSTQRLVPEDLTLESFTSSADHIALRALTAAASVPSSR